MSGCGCKSKTSSVSDEKVKAKISKKNYFLNIILFTILVLISPIFLGVIIWVLFRVLILEKEFEFLPLLMKIAGKNSEKIEEEEDDTEEDEDDDYIPINVEDITNKETK